MNKKINFGLIGYGGFGKFVCNAVSESKLVDIIAIADTNIPSGEVPDGVIFFNDWKKMLSSSAVEAVFVATPPSSHFEITRYAIESNKHVIVEKPLTITPDEAVIIRKLAEEFNRIVIVDFMLRFNPLLNKLYQLCLKNLTGPLERFYVENYAQDESLPAEHWFWDEKIQGESSPSMPFTLSTLFIGLMINLFYPSTAILIIEIILRKIVFLPLFTIRMD